MPLPFPLPAYIKTRHRRTLTLIKSVIESFISIMDPTSDHLPTSSSSSSSEPSPPFDPKQPAVPISYPIKTLEELESRAYFESFHYPFNIAKVKLQSRKTDGGGGGDAAALPNRRRMLVCHDMAGGYSDDKWVQGGNNPDAYAIWHWYLMDVFVYFSHDLVTLPPPCWTNAAHKHGVKVLGTLIMEWDEGAILAEKLLSTTESARMYAERLAELAVSLGFDGWLINMEVEIKQVSNLKEFVSHLTETMHSSVPGSLIIWYDSVTIGGKLEWQNQLNGSNKPFFDVCDGIFINYTWKESYPKLSAEVAGDRRFDVYMGIDVFGRGTYGGGQWTTNAALDVIRENDVSAAIFAPGWVYENHDKQEFQALQNRWWGLIEKSWEISQKYPQVLPFYSDFDQGHGYHFSVMGGQEIYPPWNNISCQSLQPFLEFAGDPDPNTIQCYVDFKDASYAGGANITFKGSIEDDTTFTARLFEGELVLGNSPVNVSYSVKLSSSSSLLGLVLYFSDDAKERKTVFLPSERKTLLTMQRFSSHFTKIIVPHEVSSTETDPKWDISHFSIAMEGHTLTQINALCYKLEGELDVQKLNLGSSNQPMPVKATSEYYAVLGHIMINTPVGYNLPPSSLWLVQAQDVKWTSSSDNVKYLSMKIIWQLKNGNTDLIPKYNIYVEKVSKVLTAHPTELFELPEEFLGVAEVEAFYVSNCLVPSDTFRLKFIIQVCGVDGGLLNVSESPFLQLEVEGYSL